MKRKASLPAWARWRDARWRRARPSARASRPLEQLLALLADDDRALLEGAAGGGQRVGDVGGVELGVLARGGRRGAAACAQGALAILAESGRATGRAAGASARLAPRRLDRLRRGRLLQDHVGVGAADAEGGDAGAARAAARLPGLRPRSAARPRPPPSRRARRARRRAGSAAARRARIAIDHLDHAGDAGGGLGVADVGLDRAEPQRASSRSWP